MRLLTTLTVLITLAAAGATTLAQDDENPFTGVITGDDVYVRAGAGENYYPIAELNTGAIVRVQDLFYDWYEIDAPTGSFSYISSQYVDLADDGKTGTVTGNRVNVRAPSPLGPDPTNSYRKQASLNRGATVVVVGQEEGWYRIEPPEDAVAYVHKDYVARATPQQIAAARRAAAKAQAAADEAADAATDAAADAGAAIADAAGAMSDDDTATEARPADDGDAEADAGDAEGRPDGDGADVDVADAGEATDDAADAEAAAARAATDRFAMLEQRYADVSDLPLREQPIDELLAAYRELETGGRLSEQDTALVGMRIEVLAERGRLKQARAAFDDAADADGRDEMPTPADDADADATTTVVDAADADADAATAAPAPAPRYDAVGILLTSLAYDGDRGPRMLRVVDPLNEMTIGYIEATDPNRYARLVGKLVGIVGDVRYDPGRKLKVISVDRIDPLVGASE